MYALLATGPESSTALVEVRNDDGSPAAPAQTVVRTDSAPPCGR